MIKESTYQTYLINLDRATERLKLMELEFNKCNLSYERIPAVDAKKLTDNLYTINNKYDRNFVPGEIGCYLSHVNTLEQFLKSPYQFAVILEDDAILDSNFKPIIENVIQQYNSHTTYQQWDVLKLSNGKRRHIKINNVDNKYIIGACGTSIPITTIAAIWTREAAEKFLDKTIINNKPVVRRPIDCELQHPWEYNLKIYNLLPSIVSSAEVETQIQVNDSLRKSNLFPQIRYELNRLFPKYWYLIKQHGFKKFYDSFIAKKNEKIA